MVLCQFLDEGMLVHTIHKYTEEEKALYLAQGYHEISEEDLELYETLRYGYDFKTGKPKEFPVYEPPVPTEAEIQAELTQAVQAYMDSTAQTRGYDNIHTACSYVNSTDEVFKAEGTACLAWRDSVWRKCYNILDEVKAGKRAIPTLEEVIAELPVLVW